MMKVFSVLRGVASFALIVFLVVVVTGVYTALDSATVAYGNSAVERQVEP